MKRPKKGWTFDSSLMANEEEKEKYRNDPIATSELLFHIGWALVDLAEQFEARCVSLFSAVCFSKEMWDAVNFARLWPESNHAKINEVLSDALGHLGDTHFMIESVYAWGERVQTDTTFRNIEMDIKKALTLIRKAILLTDDYINDSMGGGEDAPTS